jgi:formate-dependent nitrite reductase membrane component NrfD
VHYVGASDLVLDPLAAPVRDAYLWAQPDDLRRLMAEDTFGADATAVTTLNTAHSRPWGWRVATYLWTKGLGAGALLVSALAVLLGIGLDGPTRLGPVVAVIGTAVTGGLLIWDLKRPERFYYLLTKPNSSSWLVKGGYCLLVVAVVSGVWLLAQLFSLDSDRWQLALALASLPAAVMAAGYTALLFAQAEGRDLWQSPWLFPHLVGQALMTGAGAVAALTLWGGAPERPAGLVARVLGVATVAQVAVSLLELLGRHRTANATRGAQIMTRGRYSRAYWGLTVGLAVPIAVLAAVGSTGASGAQPLVAVAGLLAQVSVLSYEFCFVRAGQEVPLS